MHWGAEVRWGDGGGGSEFRIQSKTSRCGAGSLFTGGGPGSLNSRAGRATLFFIVALRDNATK